jgi:hypothetical protein
VWSDGGDQLPAEFTADRGADLRDFPDGGEAIEPLRVIMGVGLGA